MLISRTLLVAAFITASFHAVAQSWNNLGTAVPQKHVALNENFGSSISLDGTVALIGTPGNDDVYPNSGKAVVFEKMAGAWTKVKELTPPAPATDLGFGSAVLLHGDYAIVSAPGYSASASGQGVVYVFKRESADWQAYSLLDILIQPDHKQNDLFGTSIALYGNRLAVGAPGANGSASNSGAVYLYGFDGTHYSFSKKVVSKTGVPGEQFGQTLAINDSSLFVGIVNRAPNSQGAVFVFALQNYDSIAALTMSSTSFQFGMALSATNKEVAISVPYFSNPNGSYGAVCLFQKGAGWSSRTEDFRFIPQAPLGAYGAYGYAVVLTDSLMAIGTQSGTSADILKKPPSGWGSAVRVKVFQEAGLVSQNQYGRSLAFSATDILIGAPFLTNVSSGSGTVFAYQANPAWDTPIKLANLDSPSLNAGGDLFGFAMDISGNFAVVGAVNNIGNGTRSGKAFVYQFNGTTWTLVATLTPSDGSPDDLFGTSVSITNDRVIVGDPAAAPNGTNSGAVYVFEKPVTGWMDMTESSVISKVNPVLQGQFGRQVDAYGAEIAITHNFNSGTGQSGEAYVFKKSGAGWQLEAKLTPSSFADSFGANVAFDSVTVVVGAPLSGDSRSGEVYVFQRPEGGWKNMTQTALLTSSDGAFFGEVGSSVALDRGTIVAGAWALGIAYVFEKGTKNWQNAKEVAILKGPARTTYYGVTVAVSGEYAAMTAETTNQNILIFRRKDGKWNGASPQTTLMPNQATSQYGLALKLSGDILAVANPVANTTSGGGSGLVSFYLKDPTVLRVTSSSPDGIYRENDEVNVQVIFSQNISVTGSPVLKLGLASATPRKATYVSTGAKNEINFTYTVQKNDTTPRLNYTDTLAFQGTYSITSTINSVQALSTLPLPSSPLALAGQKNIVIDGIPAITGLHPLAGIDVFPNPFGDQLVVKGEGIKEYRIVDSTGATLQLHSAGSGVIDTSQLPSGFYVLCIETAVGVQRVKIIRH